jgi:hypothetical protein
MLLLCYNLVLVQVSALIDTSASESASVKSPLRLVCVGTGRDGTTSLFQMIQHAFDSEGRGRTAKHEWAAVDLQGNFCNFVETGDESFLRNVEHLLRNCPYDCIVSISAAILPYVAQLFGDRITLVHLKRRDRNACIESLVRNAELFPANHLYYASTKQATGKRIAAFHFGEATKEEWETWPLREKFAWFYDKTHALIEEYKHLYSQTFYVETETLSDDTTGIDLGRAVGVDRPLEGVHLNRHIGLDGLPLERGVRVQRLLGKLDIGRLAEDELYGLRHFLDEFLLWTSGRVGGAAGQTNAEIAETDATLAGAHELLSARLVEIEELRALTGERLRSVAGNNPDAGREILITRREAADSGRRSLFAERAAMIAERDAAVARRDEAIVQRERIGADRAAMMAERDRFLAERDRFLAERDEALAQFARVGVEREEALPQLARVGVERDEALAQLARVGVERDIYRQNCEELRASTCWRLTAPLRYLSSAVLAVRDRFGGAQEA